MVDEAEKEELEDTFDGLRPLGDLGRDEEIGTGEVLGAEVAFDDDVPLGLDDGTATEVYDIAELLVTGDEAGALTEGTDASGDAVAFDLRDEPEQEYGWAEDGSTGPSEEFDMLSGDDDEDGQDDGGEIGLERDPDVLGGDDDETELAPLERAGEEELAGDLDIGGDEAIRSRGDDAES